MLRIEEPSSAQLGAGGMRERRSSSSSIEFGKVWSESSFGFLSDERLVCLFNVLLFRLFCFSFSIVLACLYAS